MQSAHGSDPHTLAITRVLPASRDAVFDAWTTAESMRQWLCPPRSSVALVEVDLRVGGAFRIDMLHDDVARRMTHTGHYCEIRPPEKLVFTWRSEHTQYRDTLVTVELHALGDRTELRLTQTLLLDERAVHQHLQGWTLIIEHLMAYLQTI
jgi:uncharacterized protein YndB with AHSA1/START domain